MNLQSERIKIIKQIDDFFNHISQKPERMNIDEFIIVVESIIPVHAGHEITNFDQVDLLLSVYPYLYQKMIRLYAYFIHRTRIAVQAKDRNYADMMRSYRDPLGELLKAVKMQYDSLSRRITNNMERRG